jgi:hypothetical protein
MQGGLEASIRPSEGITNSVTLKWNRALFMGVAVADRIRDHYRTFQPYPQG